MKSLGKGSRRPANPKSTAVIIPRQGTNSRKLRDTGSGAVERRPLVVYTDPSVVDPTIPKSKKPKRKKTKSNRGKLVGYCYACMWKKKKLLRFGTTRCKQIPIKRGYYVVTSTRLKAVQPREVNSIRKAVNQELSNISKDSVEFDDKTWFVVTEFERTELRCLLNGILQKALFDLKGAISDVKSEDII